MVPNFAPSTGTVSTYWRKPDHSFHPYHYAALAEGENYTKKTCLWTGGGFVMPAPAPVGEEPDKTHIWLMKGSGPAKAQARSVTPLGFMRAVYAANFGEAA